MRMKSLLPILAGLSGATAMAAMPGNASAAAQRIEAESAIVDENSVQKVADAAASGGFYVGMKEGNLAFKVSMASAGFYTLFARYSQPGDANGKIQNLSVNGSSKGQMSFPLTAAFTTIKASAKIKLDAGANTIEIVKSWGWVNIDYIEIAPYVDAPFNIAPNLVNAGASANAKKVYGFLLQNFRKRTVSGFMTADVFKTDGKYTPHTVETQPEALWIKNASGKIPALMGLDLFHATGKGSDGDWHKGYTQASLAMAEEMFNKGGIPAFCWHWMDPGLTEERFYSPSSGNPFTTFDLKKAFLDTATYATFNTASAEYQAMVRDMDAIAGHLKVLADKGVPVLWRPLHEASGRWFWWGYAGPKPCKALYNLMYDRFTNHHGLDNLIWVWTSDEAGDAADWYPGDARVDIIGRDYYYYPRLANHGSLVASFEKLKDIFGGTKMIALSENGSVPHPDSMAADGAGWSYFMPWYGDYTMDGWAHDNTAADWNSILNHADVLTLDEMPGWAAYVPPVAVIPERVAARQDVTLRYERGALHLALTGKRAEAVELFTVGGVRLGALNPQGPLAPGSYRFPVGRMGKGVYLVRVKSGTGITFRSVLLTGE